MTAPVPRRLAAAGGGRPTEPSSAEWLRLARLARMLSWVTLGWMGIEGGVATGAAIAAGSAALLGFGLDSGIEAMASVIVIWRLTGTRLASAGSERRAQQLVAVSFFLLAPYIAVEAAWALAAGDRAETSIPGLVLTAGTAVLEPALGVAKRRIGKRLGSAATAGEGTQNLLCAYLAVAVFAGLAANTLLGAWWLDGVIALVIAVWAVAEGRRAWAGRTCGCACQAAASPSPGSVIPGEDLPYLPDGVVNQQVPGSGIGPPHPRRSVQDQAEENGGGQDPVDQRDPALGPQHEVIQRPASAGLASGQREHRRGGHRGPGDPEHRVPRAVSSGQDRSGLHQKIDGQGGEPVPDQPESPALPPLAGAGQFPDHDNRRADLDQ